MSRDRNVVDFGCGPWRIIAYRGGNVAVTNDKIGLVVHLTSAEATVLSTYLYRAAEFIEGDEE